MEGYIKLYRKLIESPVFCNEKLLKVWIWCLCRASHTEKKQMIGLQEIEIKCGQFIFSLTKASEELNISKTTLRRYFDTLKKMKMLDIKTEQKWTVATIENWGSYQQSKNKSGTKTERKRNDGGTVMELNKNEKNVKNDKNNIYIYPPLGEFENVLLSEEELEKLKVRFPYDWQDKVEGLSRYIASHGKRYKNHYATILAWDRNNKHESETKKEGRLDWIDEI